MSVFSRFITVVTLIAFFLIVIGAVMTTRSSTKLGHAKGCIIVIGGEAICTMNLADNLAIWKQIIAATLPPLTLILTIITLAIFVLRFYLVKFPLSPALSLWRRQKKRYYFLKPFDYLLQAWSSGDLRAITYL